MMILAIVSAVIAAFMLYDLLQTRHAILRNFPIVGHFRYWLETVGPELRQYIVTSNNEERPFSRHQRRWIYASSKKENEYFGFGSDRDMEMAGNYTIVKPSTFPYEVKNPNLWQQNSFPLPCAKILGAYRKRKHAFRPQSIVNISAMSFGSLSGTATEALNRGAARCGSLHNTGEGGISIHHKHGGNLIWQLGSGYFGCRTEEGRFDLQKFKDVVQANPVKAIEVKLSQGAKPGVGGILPASKISKEIAEARGIPRGKDCKSPSLNPEFSSVDGLLDFVEMLADESGLPVGIKAAVGELDFWGELASEIEKGTRSVDFITIDGGEGGTGAAPLVFSDHVALPFKMAFSRVYSEFAKRGLHHKIVFIGSGKLGFPENALIAFALGCDMVNIAREAMLALGCIQAQRCHTNHCPTGVATQSAWLQRGLVPGNKAERVANYISTLRKEVLRVCWSCGVQHPAMLSSTQIEILDSHFGSRTVEQTFGYQPDWSVPNPDDLAAIRQIMDELEA